MKIFLMVIIIFLTSCITSIDSKYRDAPSTSQKSDLTYVVRILKYTEDGIIKYTPQRYVVKTLTSYSYHGVQKRIIDYGKWGKMYENDIKNNLIKKGYFASEKVNKPDIIINIEITKTTPPSTAKAKDIYNIIAASTFAIFPVIEKKHSNYQVSFVDGKTDKILKNYATDIDYTEIMQLLLLPLMPFKALSTREIDNNAIIHIIHQAKIDGII